ncbi:MAG TPA: NAD(P)/FAD-dependent oxidoreductase, partial [Longimicrobiales bacterium]|nr:NAD(P)/FAD-dependent oxidoreductase [Longimicrobiales bacterium]
MDTAEKTDLLIIGGGPTGLFAAFYAGLRGASARIVDSLPELGGQLMALYPEKYIYDVGGFPRILARDLARNMIEQGLQWDADVRLEEQVLELNRQEDGGFMVTTERAAYPCRAVLICGGKGAFAPRVLECPGYEDLLEKGVTYHVRDPEHFRDKRVLIVGGGDSALDWALALKDVTARLVLIHRREGFRAHRQTVKQMEQAVAEGSMELLTHREVREIHGDACVRAVTLFDNRTDEDERIEVDAVLSLIGFKPDLGPIGDWGLELERNTIKVGPLMQTNLPGVFAAGDIARYEGKLELIATGYAEAAVAVNNAVHYYDPKARVNPGHSTTLKVFKEREAEQEAAEEAAEEAA